MSDQPEAGCREIRYDERPAQSFREPLHEMCLLAGIDLNRVADLNRERAVRSNRISGDRPCDRTGRQ
jgi:hypothetical protein